MPNPMDDAALASFLVRLETKLDQALSGHSDHEARLRAQEARKTVSPRDLWTGLTGAAAAGAAIASIINAIIK